ncbi:MAG: hypothetical protein H7Y38_15630 [Armatimonadetes bacterium]|nr:hypothetical protein [Armatimonadota bacterium]
MNTKAIAEKHGVSESTVNAEARLYQDYLCGEMSSMIHRLRRISPEHFDKTFALPAPTPRQLAVYAWSWLQFDRAHIEEPDATKHPRLPDPPTEPAALCDALGVEVEKWYWLLLSLTPEQLNEGRLIMNSQQDGEVTVRQLIVNTLRNNVRIHGEFTMLYIAWGYDKPYGNTPHTAQLPNPFYDQQFGKPKDTA